VKPRAEVRNELKKRISHNRFVTLFVRREPISIIVIAQLFKKLEEFGREVLFVRHDSTE
jgi:hypothetical protein